MDSIEKYRDIVEAVLKEQTKIPYAHGEISFETVFDRSNDRYLLMLVGWKADGRVHGCLVHLDIINGKVWIQRDGTEEGIAADLERAGIPKDHIVLAFRRPDVRQYTDYAAA